MEESKKIDLIDINNKADSTNSAKSKKKKKSKIKRLIKTFIFISIFTSTGFLVFSSQVVVSEHGSTSWIGNLPIIKQIRNLAESSERKLKGEERDRINILLLGMGGKNHEGGLLTDTIMIASLEPTTKKVALTSVPRDLSIPVEGMGWQKINAINAYAEAKTENSGGLATCQAISDTFNMPIDYYFRVDFASFVNIVDILGGVDVDVDNTLDDYSYPVAGREEAEDYESRFEHLHIEKGEQHMDGTLALKYARSRHAIGIEGSDFARAKRQQKIIVAIKDKALSFDTLTSPKKLTDIYGEFSDKISTNLKLWEMLRLWSMFKDISKNDIIHKVLDNGPGGLLVDGRNENGAYILSPRNGDFAEIQYFTTHIFTDVPEEDKKKVLMERSSVDIRNGTWINGLASEKALDLEKYGFKISRVGNCSQQNFQKSVIYDLTYGEKMNSLTVLKNRTSANVAFGLPDWLVEDIKKENEVEQNPTQPDFILIIGQNVDMNKSGQSNQENGEELEEKTNASSTDTTALTTASSTEKTIFEDNETNKDTSEDDFEKTDENVASGTDETL